MRVNVPGPSMFSVCEKTGIVYRDFGSYQAFKVKKKKYFPPPSTPKKLEIQKPTGIAENTGCTNLYFHLYYANVMFKTRRPKKKVKN